MKNASLTTEDRLRGHYAGTSMVKSFMQAGRQRTPGTCEADSNIARIGSNILPLISVVAPRQIVPCMSFPRQRRPRRRTVA